MIFIINDVINRLKKEKGITNAKLADESGLTLSTIDKITAGINTNPKLDTLQAICKVLNCTLDDLDDSSKQVGMNINPSEQAHIIKYRQLNADGQNKVDEYTTDLVDSGKYAVSEQQNVNIRYTDIPVYNELAAAGIGNYLQDSTYEMMSFPLDSIPDSAEFGVRISGDSMEPTIKNGCIVWIKPQMSIENGEIGIFVINNDAFCKRLHIDYDKEIVELISDNPDYRPIVVTKNDNLFTMGKVLGASAKSAPVTDFKPVNKGRVIRGRAVAFGGATMETELNEQQSMEVTKLLKKIKEEKNKKK